MSLELAPPPTNRVKFKWVFSASCLETYIVIVDDRPVGNMCQIHETLWRIDALRELSLVTGLGANADECKARWWVNWQSHDKPGLKQIKSLD